MPPPLPLPSSSSSSSSSSSHHFSHCNTLYDVDASLLPADDYYARSRRELTSYERDLDGASAPVTVRRVGKSGLLEIAETDTIRGRVFTGAEDVATRPAASLRLDRSGLLEAVPEAVDQLEEDCNNNGGASNEHDATMRTFDNEEAGEVTSRGETFKMDADVDPRVFDRTCCAPEQPSSSEGQACQDEVSTRVHSADIQVPAGSPRFDVSTKATERLPPHLLSFSPGPSLRRPRGDSSRGSSLLTNRCADVDSFAARLRNQRSPEFTAKYSPANSTPMNLHGTLTSSLTTATSPIMRGQPQTRCSKDPASLDSMVDVSTDPIKASRDSLLAKGSTEQEDDGLPGEERAEAEGCEHTAVEGLEEDDVSFKGSNKLLDNDNVQTLRVIILSEQL